MNGARLLGDKAATNSRRPDLPAQLGHRGSGRSQPPPHQGPASRTGTRQCPPAADLQPGASSVWAEPRPLVIRVPRHRKYHRCTRSAAPRPCLAADPHPRRVLLGHCGYAPGGGAAPRSAPCPIRSLPRMGPPTRGIVEVAHPRRRRRASPRAGPRRVLLGHSRYDPGWGGASTPAHAQYDLCPGWLHRPGAVAVSPQRCSRLPSCAAGPRCVLMGHCGQGRAEEVHRRRARSIRSLPQMARSTRGTAGIVPARSRLPSSAVSPRRVLRGTSGMARVGEELHRRGPLTTISAPDGPNRPGALRVSSLRRSHLASTGARRPSGCGESCEWRGTRPIPLSPFASTWSERVTPRQYHSCPTSLRTQPKWRVPAAETSL
jgi:hypothetical protein